MRNFDEKRKTRSNSVYRRAVIYPHLGCPICEPHRGCNMERNNPFKSWKYKYKKRKQWMYQKESHRKNF
jgi:hypothetical protein